MSTTISTLEPGTKPLCPQSMYNLQLSSSYKSLAGLHAYTSCQCCKHQGMPFDTSVLLLQAGSQWMTLLWHPKSIHWTFQTCRTKRRLVHFLSEDTWNLCRLTFAHNALTIHTVPLDNAIIGSHSIHSVLVSLQHRFAPGSTDQQHSQCSHCACWATLLGFAEGAWDAQWATCLLPMH